MLRMCFDALLTRPALLKSSMLLELAYERSLYVAYMLSIFSINCISWRVRILLLLIEHAFRATSLFDLLLGRPTQRSLIVRILFLY